MSITVPDKILVVDKNTETQASINLLTKYSCGDMLILQLNYEDRLWKLGVNPTQGRCCNSPILWLLSLERFREGTKCCVLKVNAGDKSEYLPVFLPRDLRGAYNSADHRGYECE